MKFAVVEFNGNEYLGRRQGDEGFDYPLTTKEDYMAGRCSYAHVFGDKIMRFNKQIGTARQLKFKRFEEVEPDFIEFMDGLLGDSWPR